MAEYLAGVVIMSAILGLISYASYPSGSERATKFAVSVLLLYTALMPAFSLISKLSSVDIDSIIENGYAPDFDQGGEYIEVAEESFKSGISKLIFTKYGVPEENIEVFVFGFNFESMRADSIKVILSGSGAFADFRGIEEYITEQGLGKCEVVISFG